MVMISNGPDFLLWFMLLSQTRVKHKQIYSVMTEMTDFSLKLPKIMTKIDVIIQIRYPNIDLHPDRAGSQPPD